ncbi:MAG: TonB-dependent receptor [Bryobacterales bacterium]|nr:TonB-dependent receptor [Bryobacterales bacterium]
MRRLAPAVLFLAAGRLIAADPVAVKVVDPHGFGVPGAVVEVRDPADGRTIAAVRSNPAGEAELPLTLPAALRASADGFDAATVPVRAGQAGPVTIRLTPAVVRSSVEVVVSEPALVETATVGTAVEIDRTGARTVFDAVDQLVPGAFVTRRGVMGYGIATNGTGMVSIRGIGGSPNTGVLIVVDGRPDMQGLMGHPLPDFYSLSNAESVSVTEGPASVLYGSNAMGGAIEIFPSRPLGGTHTRLSSSLGSFLTGQHRLAHETRWEKTYYTLHAGIDHTRGERDGAAYRSKDAALGFGRDLSSAWRASLQGRYGHFHVEDPGPVTAPLAGSYARVGRGGFSLNLDNGYGRTWGYLRLFSSHGRHIITDGFRSVDSTTGARVHQSFSLTSRLALDAGTEAFSYGGRATNVLGGLNYGEHHISTAAGFSRVQYNAGSRLRLNTGLRYEHNSAYGQIAVPEFGASFKLRTGYTLGVMAGKGFRSPTIRELYLFPAPNPLLRPETLWNYQATLRLEPSRSFQSSITAYYADVRDMIVTTGRFPNLALRNSGVALNRGVETTVRWRPLPRVQLTNGYAYLRSTNLAPYIPAHKWNFAADLDAGKAYLRAGVTAVGERWANAARTARMGSYSTVSLKGTLPVGRGRSFFVMLDNLLDRRYEVVPGYPMPGVNAAGGFTLEF